MSDARREEYRTQDPEGVATDKGSQVEGWAVFEGSQRGAPVHTLIFRKKQQHDSGDTGRTALGARGNRKHHFRDLAKVFEEAMEKFREGEAKYGPFDSQADTRDLVSEAEREILDAINYLAMHLIKVRFPRE